MAGDNGYAHTKLRMNDDRRGMSGSQARDLFRLLHKQNLPPHMFGLDLDFIWVEKRPYKVIAGLDLKVGDDGCTFAEVVAYNEWVAKVAPLFLLYASSIDSVELGVFTIHKYLGGDPGPVPPTIETEEVMTVQNWEEFGAWQQRVRNYIKRKGWPLS